MQKLGGRVDSRMVSGRLLVNLVEGSRLGMGGELLFNFEEGSRLGMASRLLVSSCSCVGAWKR